MPQRRWRVTLASGADLGTTFACIAGIEPALREQKTVADIDLFGPVVKVSGGEVRDNG